MKKIIFTLIIFCLSITSVRAYQMALTGDDTLDSSLNISLDITDLAEYDSFYGLTASLNYDKDKLELLSITGNKDFNLTYSAKTNKIVLYSATGTKEKISIINFKFKNIGLMANEESELKLENITATDSNKDIKVDNLSKIIKATSNGNPSDNYLTDIKINGKSLNLDKNELNYDIVVSHDTQKINVKAFSNNENTIVGDGIYELAEGNNEIKITVKDKNNEEKTYIVNVTRENSDAFISDEDLFIKTEKFKWNNLYFIPIGLLILISLILIIKKKKGNK